MFNKIKNFFKEVKIELKKVVFPDRDAVIGSTKVVIITVVIMSLFLGLVDIGLAKLVNLSLR
ncbi:MAG: preprotein translocase subunit SecE [Deltaproteobacteria bacterium RBG_16_42_7]|nr:MAG: preprotein translocase subunit SecE [Deltaproteobacteria bacterium RBG_16_42_7]